MKNVKYIIIAVILLVVFLPVKYCNSGESIKVKTDTTIVYDTITIHDSIPVEKIRTITKTEKIYIPVIKDSIKNDTLPLNINIVSVDYELIQDTVAKVNVRVSGPQIGDLGPRVDFINIDAFRKTQFINTTVTKTKNPKLSFGLQVGFGGHYGMVNKNVDIGPYVGIGVTYKF